jgi:hypothetical protein
VLRTALWWVYSMGMTQTSTEQLFTGRDILAAENHLRCVSAGHALALIKTMPAEVVTRLAAHVGADPSNLLGVVICARMPYANREKAL